MTPFNPQRRDLLRVGSLGVAGAAIPAVSFAAAAGSQSAASNATPSSIFNVRQYGATGDGKTLDTAAINRAIEAAAAAGGGVVLFPAGDYLCFSIHLKSNVHLHLDQGATILAAESPKPGEATGYNGGTYDAAEPNAPWEPYQDYGHNHWHNSLFWGEDLHDISITGPGLIYGKGLSFGAAAPIGSRGGYPIYVAEQPGVGNKAIALKNCRNVLLRDFSILKGGHFALLAHRRRQPHHRQSHHRHRSRRHRHRLLPERSRLQLHRQLALGRRHLPQVQLRSRLRPRHA